MNKTGRNAPCPCGSGKKYKKCCLPLQDAVRAGVAQSPTLTRSVAALQAVAAERGVSFTTLGVFILFSNIQGDAWLLEATERDAVQVAAGGAALAVAIEEGPETLAVNWSHRFSVQDEALVLSGYADEGEYLLSDCPLVEIKAALERIEARLAPQLRHALHVDDKSPPPLTPSH